MSEANHTKGLCPVCSRAVSVANLPYMLNTQETDCPNGHPVTRTWNGPERPGYDRFKDGYGWTAWTLNTNDPREFGTVTHSTSSVGVVWVTAYGSAWADGCKSLRRRVAAYSRTHGFGRAVSEGASFHAKGATVEIRVCYRYASL